MIPDRVTRTETFAAGSRFQQSCDADVGRLLSVLAASVPSPGRILEIGTGGGVGLAWLVEGVGGRTDVDLVTVDNDAELSAAVACLPWPSHVTFHVEDALQVVPELGAFDLVFADAIAGKWFGLDVAIDATASGGLFVVDDMTPSRWASAEHEAKTGEVRRNLMSDRRLIATELTVGTGVILATRRAT